MMRDYAKIAQSIDAIGDRAARMQHIVDRLWDALHPTGVSWVGFYTNKGADELILSARRDKPACSPIGMHGACGRAFLSRQTLIVRDVAELGANYIACDPRDRSEIVIPLFEQDGSAWGVLDLDSYDVGAFSQSDADGLLTVLRTAGLTS